jgi:hypothetical protein
LFFGALNFFILQVYAIWFLNSVTTAKITVTCVKCIGLGGIGLGCVVGMAHPLAPGG